MAIAFCVLASGSRGNSMWLRGGDVEILVDCGLSARQIEERLAEAGGNIEEIRAIVCTHAHIDHVAGAAVLARRYGVDVYATPATLHGIPNTPPRERLHRIPQSGSFAIEGLEVRTVPTPHDAPGSVALVFRDRDSSLGVVTDLGERTDELTRALSNLDGLILECNHDSEMLVTGPYPEFLKRRILSREGHLSNAQGAELLVELVHPGLQHVTLAHLSETNNTPATATDAVASALAKVAGVSLVVAVADQHRPGEPVVLAPGPATPRESPRKPERPSPARNAQLSLPHCKD